MKKNNITPLANIPSQYMRYEYNTYLSVPKWYLIFIRNDYSEFIKTKPSHLFPYFKLISNFWKSYSISSQHAEKYKKFTLLSDIRIILLGISVTAEFSLRFFYEKTVGLFTQYFYPEKIEQDEIIEMTERDYNDFIKYHPWYEFDFFSRWLLFIKKSFKIPHNFAHLVRLIDRTFYFSSFIFVKSFLSFLIRFIHFIDHHQPDTRTALELDYFPEKFSQDSFVDTVGEHLKRVVIAVPRYFSFQDYIKELDKDNIIYSIAGNSRETLILCTIPDGIDYRLVKLSTIFIHNSIVNNSIRVIYSIRVSDIISFNIFCQQKNIQIEHIFDF